MTIILNATLIGFFHQVNTIEKKNRKCNEQKKRIHFIFNSSSDAKFQCLFPSRFKHANILSFNTEDEIKILCLRRRAKQKKRRTGKNHSTKIECTSCVACFKSPSIILCNHFFSFYSDYTFESESHLVLKINLLQSMKHCCEFINSKCSHLFSSKSIKNAPIHVYIYQMS